MRARTHMAAGSRAVTLGAILVGGMVGIAGVHRLPPQGVEHAAAARAHVDAAAAWLARRRGPEADNRAGAAACTELARNVLRAYDLSVWVPGVAEVRSDIRRLECVLGSRRCASAPRCGCLRELVGDRATAVE